MDKMLIYDLVALVQQSYFLEYNNIKYIEVHESLIKITKKFRVFIVIDSHHLQTEEKQLVVCGQQYTFHSSYQPKFYLIFPQISFQHSNYSYFEAQDFAEQLFLQNIFHCLRLIYMTPIQMTPNWNIHFDYEIYFVQMKKLLFLHLLYLFSELNKGRPGII